MRCAAVLLPLATILIVVWPNLRGTAGTGAETFFDITDPLFGDATATAPRFHDDPSPVVYDWPRDRRLRERVRAGHFDLWNPVPGNGVPLSSDPGGIFSPFRLLLYAAPGDPYTAFVLFRVARLFVAALGTYLLARVCGLSRPGGAVAGIVFGLSGGMISQLPFATVASVCWLPWICWAQQRIALRGTAAAAVPHALAVAAAMTGGHQTIVTGVVLGALVHGAGVVAAQRSRGTWRRTALLAATGYGLGALLAAPAILASAELVANGHSYKAALPAAFRTASSEMNLSLLFVGAVIPQTIDALRTAAGFSYPYVLNFSGGLLAYVLATVAVVRRRWRFEWALLLLFGIAMCFGPPGFAWIAAVPFVKDILPRYMWALCMLPLALAAAAGADALWWRAGARDPVRAPARVATSAGTDGPARRAAAATVARAIALFAIATGAMAWITWHGFPGVGAAVTGALSASPHARLLAGAPAVAVVVTLTGAAALARLRRPWTPWLLAVATCIEVAAIALPHLREPPSRLIREDFPHETSDLADQIADEHGRVGGSAPLVVGWRGWREVRSVTPLAPVRYARFIEAAAGPVRWTGFGMPANRSALGDLAAVGTVIVPRTAETNLEGDPELVRVADINGVSIFRNRAALPRARVVHTTVVARTTDDAVARLASGTQGAAHVSTTPLADSVILEGVADAPPPRELHGGRATPATFIADDPDDVILQVDAPQEGYLVLADTHYPGWRATVDGHPRAIYPANVGFRAVHVETGRHQVAFHFRPASFRAGMACALLGLLACGAISIAAALRARRRPASPTY